MKTLNEIMNLVTNRPDWLTIYWNGSEKPNWRFDPSYNDTGAIFPNYDISGIDATLICSISYSWTYGLLPEEVCKEIQTAIENRDYKTWDKYRDAIPFLSTYAFISLNNEIIGSIFIGSEEIFKAIDYIDCEHG